MNSAREHRTCPSCGAAIPANAPEGICPKCLMAAAAVVTEAGQTGGKRPEPPSLERLAAAFPQLEVIELIGQGGMGAVYKARQKQLDRIVALKVLPPGIGGDPSFAERFTREAKALAKLLHPNIVALFEFGQADGIYYLLMEYVDGVSLGQLLRSSRVSAREALAIVPQICDALQYAHDQGIVHRDIKPENILLDRRGRVKVADFGLAKLVESNAPLTPSLSPSDEERVAARPGEGGSLFHTAAGKIMGTPNYMAPEQVEHPGEVDHRADIYALGVVFYQMLTGELPGKRLEAPSKKVQIDVRLDEVVMRALEKDPERRYAQASVLKTQVETIATDMRSATAPPTETPAKDGAGEATTLCATKKKKGEFIGIGCAIQALGIACFFIPPAGWVLGLVLLLLGGRMALKVLCSHCGNPTTREARICTTCGAHFLRKGESSPLAGQVEGQRSKCSWIGTLPKLNGPFVLVRGNRRVLNWPVIGYVVGMVLAMFCVVLRIMDHGSRANLILLFGLFAVDYIVRGWRNSLSSLESKSVQPGSAPALGQGRDYRTRQTLFGLPLVHVAWGIDPATGRPRAAKGVLAVGPVAYGVIAVGFSAWGLLPCGLVAGGLLPVGVLFAVGFQAVGLAAAGFQAVGLLALAFWHAVGLVAAGPTPIGLERIVVDKGTVGLMFALATVGAWLMDRLIRAIGSAATLPARRTEGKGPEGASSTARRKLPWIYCVCIVILLLIELSSWWTRREPMGVWIPTRIDATVSVDYGEAAVRVTDVSRLGQVVLVKLVCEIADSFRAHQLIVQYSGPVLDYPAHIASTVTNVDSLVAPTFVNGGGKALVGAREMPGAPAWQIGFVLPDEMTAAKVVEQLRATHLGKPRWLAEHRVLLLFSLHRNVGKDAKGKPVLESMSGMLGWSRDNESAVESTPALSFGPVIERRVNLEFGTNCAIDLDSGRLMNGFDDVEEQGADAAGFGAVPVSNQTLIGLLCINGTFAMPVDATNWDNSGADWVRRRADKLPYSVKASELPSVTVMMMCSEDGELPSTYLFKTREGGRGILQITGFTENPPALKIRYKLVLAQSKNLSTPPVHVVHANTNTAGFGPMAECTVNFSEPEQDMFLSFETGKLMKEPGGRLNTPEPEKLHVADEVLTWAGSSGADLLIRFCVARLPRNGPFAKPQLILRSLDMVMISTNTEAWDTLSARDIATAVRSTRQPSPWNGLFWGAPSEHTFLFRTRQGSAGILLVTGFTDKPRRVKLFYKMVLPQVDGAKQTSPH